MTTDELNNYLKRLEKLYKDNKITLDEGKTWVKVQKLLMGPCYKCKHNDGTPNSYCENCEE